MSITIPSIRDHENTMITRRSRMLLCDQTCIKQIHQDLRSSTESKHVHIYTFADLTRFIQTNPINKTRVKVVRIFRHNIRSDLTQKICILKTFGADKNNFKSSMRHFSSLFFSVFFSLFNCQRK